MDCTCCVIGRTQLAIDCSKVLLKRGIKIEYIFTEDADFQQWAGRLTIPYSDTEDVIKKEASFFAKFDYLFSIVNDILVPLCVLSAVKELSINYHNALLPKYGGANATHWALISGEKVHGVVWHKMVEQVDSGAVLVRREVIIDPSDDLLSLNWKCWEAARESFNELCRRLPFWKTLVISDNPPTIYKGIHDKPSAFCILNFECAAQEIYNFFKGTCHLTCEGNALSSQPNEMGLPKLFLSDLKKMFVVTGMNILKEIGMHGSVLPGGSLVSVTDHLRITTSDHDILITGLMELDGSPVPKPFAKSLPLLRIGAIVNTPEAKEKGSYLWKLSQYSLAGRHERKWVNALNHPRLRIKDAVPVLKWPYSMSLNTTNETYSMPSDIRVLLCTVDSALFLTANSALSYPTEILVLASFLCYLILLTPTISGSIDIKINGISNEALYLQSILCYIPASFQLLKTYSFLEAINHISQKLYSCVYGQMKSGVRVKTVASDVFLRYSLEPIRNEVIAGIMDGEDLDVGSFPNKRVGIFCSKKTESIDIILVNPVFPNGSSQSLKDNFISFLNGALSSLEPLLQQATLCSKDEMSYLLHHSPVLIGPKCEQSYPKWFHAPFEDIVRKFPFAIAVMDETGQYTYGELNQKAENIANAVIEKSNGKHFKRIALLLDRTWLSLAATIASLKLGVTYIPLEIESPVVFNCQILEDAKADILLVDDNEHWLQHWQEYTRCTCRFRVVTLHDIPHSFQPVQQEANSSPDDPAVLLYTSGTTGKPKGILVTHRGLCNVINCFVKRMGIQSCDIVEKFIEYSLYDASPTFDTCFLQIFSMLWNGGVVIVVPIDPLKPNNLHHFFRHVTFLSTTPRKLFLYKAADFLCAKNVAVAGEDPSLKLYKKWERANRTLWNLYGPTEISVITTMGTITNQVHMGKAMDNSLLRILSPFQKPVPIGVPGELYILGVGVAPGYTCKKATESAFGMDLETGLRWYRSGDVVVLDHSGVLRYIGRIPSDEQVKIGGKRVEPLGIECALKTFPGIEYVEVKVERPALNVNLLVAYVAPESVDVKDLELKLKRLLPEHMLPSLIVPVDLSDAELSRTGKIKLDKTKYRHKLAQSFQPASTELGRELLASYREFLGITDNNILGMKDTFKAFGGDSVIAVTLADQINGHFGWNVKPLEILYCTPAEIMEKHSAGFHAHRMIQQPEISSHCSTDQTQSLLPPLALNKQVAELHTELSSMQQSLLQLRITQIGASYNIPIVFEITGNFNILHLTTTFERMLCNLPSCKGSDTSVTPLLNEMDLSSCHNPRETALLMIQKDACTPLDLKTTVYRCKIYHLGNAHCIFSLVIHHSAFDYQSWNALQSISGHTTSNFVTSFVRWTMFVQSEYSEYATKKKEIDQFWRDQLCGFPYFIPFPSSFSRPLTCQHRGRRMVKQCDATLYQKLYDVCIALDVQQICFILSLFALLIHQLSHQPKFCIAVICSRRTTPELKDTVGFVANTLVCCFTSKVLNCSFQELLEYTQSWYDKAVRQGSIPFTELTKIWGYDDSQPATPANHFPQFILNCISDLKLHSFHLGDGIRVTPISIDTYTAKAELLLDVTLSEHDFSFTWEYDTHIFACDAVEHCISRRYLKLLYQQLCSLGAIINDEVVSTEDSHSCQQLLGNWDNYDCPSVEQVVIPNPKFMLSCHQRAVLGNIIQLPQSCWGYFNCICSFEVSLISTKHNVQQAIKKVVASNPYLLCVVSANFDCFEVKSLGADVCCETVTNEKEAEAIKWRELLWPFDIWNGPLFHCSLINVITETKSKQEVLLSASLVLLDEQSLNMFCKLVQDALRTDTTVTLTYPHFTTFSDDPQSVTEAEKEYFKQVTSSKPSLTIQPLSLMEMAQNYSVTDYALGNWSSASPHLLPALSCAVAAIMYWCLKQSDQVQLCYLYDCSLTEQHLCSSERLMPLGLPVTNNAFFGDVVNAAEQILQKTPCISDYWSLQSQFDPYSDYLHPHHEVLVQVVDSSNHFKFRCIRPFLLHLKFNASSKTVTLSSTLCPQQTSVVFSAFMGITKFLQNIQNTNFSIAEMLHGVQLSPSIVQGPQLNVDTKTLCDVIITAMMDKKYAISYHCANDRVMAMTCMELHTQSKLLSTYLQRVMNSRQPVNKCVAILIEGGFELPVAVIAAVLANITFTIIDPNEKIGTIANIINIMKPAVIMYNVHQFNVIKQLFEDRHLIDIIPILVDVFSDYGYEAMNNNPNMSPVNESNEHAYVVFTSGSTGIPKAAPITGKSFCNFLIWHKAMLSSEGPLNWLQLTSLSFDICIAELLGQLYCGNTLFLSDTQKKLEIESWLLPIMSTYNIEGIYVVPTYLSYMLRQLNPSREHFLSLRHVFSTGEKLSKETCKLFFKMFTQACLHNWGGTSECCIEAVHCPLTYQECLSEVPVGTPAINCTVSVLSPSTMKPLPKLIPGEIVISGIPVFGGYIQQFLLSPLVHINDNIYYKTGDIGYINAKNQVVYLYRMDAFKKVNGQSVHLEGVRALIMQLGISGVIDAIIDVINDCDMGLVCFPVVSTAVAESHIQCILASELPKRYIPHVVQCLMQHDVPLLRSGKINYKVLREIAKGKCQESFLPKLESSCHCSDILFQALSEIVPLCKSLVDGSRSLVLTLDALGVSSMQKVALYERLKEKGVSIELSTLLMDYTLHDIINIMNRKQQKAGLHPSGKQSEALFCSQKSTPIAILNLQVNVQGAVSCDQLWDVIINCREEISHNLNQSAATSDNFIDDNKGFYVGSRGLVTDKSMFDADFFKIPPIQAEMLDPQQRMLLQMVWTALEETGHVPDKLSEGKKIGLFAGVQFPYYMLKCLRESDSTTVLQDDIIWNNLRDNVALLIGRALNFRGPCITVANNCATFAVALHCARTSLILEECDIAVVAAGSVAPEDAGYYCREGSINSKDGQCRPFSQRATGTVMSDGLTVAVLKRLRDAELEKDTVLCVIKGTAVGSDGTLSGITYYYVPSSKGQSETLQRVLKNSEVDPSTILLVEAHGTGTKVGDLIELESLTSIFEKCTNKCILGSIKGNIGHTGVAAAGPSIIKAALALKHATLPPSMHCEDPVEQLKESKCFKVATKPIHWPSSNHKRRALVHCIGAMGTNCAIILEEYQGTADANGSLPQSSTSERPVNACYPICISAKTPSALKKICDDIKQHVQKGLKTGFLHSIRDISYTLVMGRANFQHRSAAAVTTVDELVHDSDLSIQSEANSHQPLCIMFSGFGQGHNIDSSSFKQFSKDFPCFGDTVQKCYNILSTAFPKHKSAFSNYAEGKSVPENGSPFLQIFNLVFQVAMYNSLKALGVRESFVLGHSLGEYSAAFAAGVLSLEDIMIIAFKRALLVEEAQYDAKMLTVDLSGKTVQDEYIEKGSSLEIAFYNSPSQCVVSGLSNEIESLCTHLNDAKVKNQIAQQSKAFHHSNLKKIEIKFKEYLEQVKIKAQKVKTKWVTCIRGNCKINQEGSEVSLDYWNRHLTSPVDFCGACKCLNDLLCGKTLLAVEIGVQSSINALLLHNEMSDCTSVFTLEIPHTTVHKELCRLWAKGTDVQFQNLLLFSNARRLKLPTYPFQMQHYWISDHTKDDLASHFLSYKDVNVQSVLSFIRQYSSVDCLPEDSLNLMLLGNEVHRKYGVSISHLLREKKLPTEVAEYIVACSRKHSEEVTGCVELLTSGTASDDKPSIFILYAVAGKLYSFQPLANSLSDSFVMYGAYSSDALVKCKTMESLGEFYASEIRKVQRRGPYYVGGFSFGAWVAHAVSKHLSAAGECVQVLVLIDPVPMKAIEASVLRQPTKFVNRFVDYGDQFVLHAMQQHSGPALVENFAEGFKLQSQLLVQYRQSYMNKVPKCPVLIVLARNGIALKRDKALVDAKNWQTVSEGMINVQEVPGNHSTCVASSNCHNVARAICNVLMLPFQSKAVPVCSDHEIQGLWRLKGIAFHDGIKMNDRSVSGGQIKITHNNYACIVPHMAKDISENMFLFLNSFGKLEIADQQTNFAIEASGNQPDRCPCNVAGVMMAEEGILMIDIDGFILSFSQFS